MKGETVKWLTDNPNMTRIIEHGSRKHSLQEIAVYILSILIQTAILRKYIPSHIVGQAKTTVFLKQGVLRHAANSKAAATLVVSEWPLAYAVS